MSLGCVSRCDQREGIVLDSDEQECVVTALQATTPSREENRDTPTSHLFERTLFQKESQFMK